MAAKSKGTMIQGWIKNQRNDGQKNIKKRKRKKKKGNVEVVVLENRHKSMQPQDIFIGIRKVMEKWD